MSDDKGPDVFMKKLFYIMMICFALWTRSDRRICLLRDFGPLDFVRIGKGLLYYGTAD